MHSSLTGFLFQTCDRYLKGAELHSRFVTIDRKNSVSALTRKIYPTIASLSETLQGVKAANSVMVCPYSD